MVNFVVDIDVAAPPDTASEVVRDFMLEKMPNVHYQGSHVPNAGTVKLLKANGPAGGNPLVRTRFRMRSHAEMFIWLWFAGDADPEFVEQQITVEETRR